MVDRKKLVEGVLADIRSMKHKLMEGYLSQKEACVTPSQGSVLCFLSKNPSTNVKSVAEFLRITSSAATQLIDGLVKNDLLVRKIDSSDRRVVVLNLSEKARKLIKKFKTQGLEKMMMLFEVLADEELVKYAALNKKIADGILNKKL